ncbi:MAG: adenylyl-sulfate kinase [Sedimentisphaerales bacterium]|nr:adenylyl-sulfate kinase [Sedimentisphaerales bacterium]
MILSKNALVLWLTGLSGAGKTTLARHIARELESGGKAVERLDGDVLRGYFPSTGFTREARDEHILRVGFMASLLAKHGIIVVCSFISPYRQARRKVRQMCHNFIEVYVKASLAECERRDVKGLYTRARAGEVRNFTGLDDPYEEPENPELVIDTEKMTEQEAVQTIINYLKKHLDV